MDQLDNHWNIPNDIASQGEFPTLSDKTRIKEMMRNSFHKNNHVNINHINPYFPLFLIFFLSQSDHIETPPFCILSHPVPWGYGYRLKIVLWKMAASTLFPNRIMVKVISVH